MRDDHAVTPIIGTILVLAVTVAGIGTTMLLGVPVITRLQNQSSLEAMAAQFAELRADTARLSTAGASVAPGMTLAGGKLTIIDGSRFAITVIQEENGYAGCDLRLTSWADGDTLLNVVYTIDVGNTTEGCRTPAAGNPNAPFTGAQSAGRLPCATAINAFGVLVGDTADLFYCVRAHRLPDLSTNRAQLVLANTVQLSDPLARDEEWRLIFSDNDNVTRAEIWILNTERLEWNRGDANAYYEAGALFVQGAGVRHIEGAPNIQEGRGAVGDPLRIVLPTWQDSAGSTLSGSGLHSLRVTYDNGQLLMSTAGATRVRFDFYGELAQAWCNTLLVRNGTANLATGPYREAPEVPVVDAGHQCNAASPNADRVRAVVYDPDLNAGPATTRFPMSLSRQVLHARLEP